MPALARRFQRDEGGFVLVFLAVAIPALLGLVGLAIDGSRLMTLDAELANLADATALAAATRLDRSDGAIRNAREAANAVFARAPLADRGGGEARLSFRFAARLSDLRLDPGYSLSDAGGADAIYVEVATAEHSLTTSFLQLVGALASPIRRRATAESQYYACDVTPAVMCHPDPDEFVAKASPGRQYLLRMDGNRTRGSILPLDRSDNVNGRQTLINLASDAPQFCFSDGVQIRTNISPAAYDEALNVRFDRYFTQLGPTAPDLAVFPPAPNVIQGRRLDTCASAPQGGDINPPYRLPRDTAYSGMRLSGFWDQGSGDWKVAPAIGGTGLPAASALEEYIAWNHANKSPQVQNGLRSSRTRYELYLKELGLTAETEATRVDTSGYGPAAGTMPTGGPRAGSFAGRGESPVPICFAGGARPYEARRRIIYLSIADCGGFPAAATAANLSRRVGKFFMTEPSELGATLLEFVDLVKPTADDGKLRHVVQLVEAN